MYPSGVENLIQELEEIVETVVYGGKDHKAGATEHPQSPTEKSANRKVVAMPVKKPR